MERTNSVINSFLDMAGIKHSHNGFRYLVSAIEIGIWTPQMLIKISDLYEAVAKMYNTTSVRVERSIRYSILGTNLTNKDFISRAIDQIVNQYQRIPSDKQIRLR